MPRSMHELEIREKMRRSGFGLEFLAKRIYKPMEYKVPSGGRAFIHEIVSLGKDSRSFRSQPDLFDKRLNILHYALDFKDHYDLETLPEGVLSYEEILEYKKALKNPSQANIEILLNLELDEKLEMLKETGVSYIVEEVDNLIKKREIE